MNMFKKQKILNWREKRWVTKKILIPDIVRGAVVENWAKVSQHISLSIQDTDVCGTFNKFPDFLVQVFKIVIDSWTFSMLLLYILWDDYPIFMISGLNEQLQQQLEYTLIATDGEFQKCNLDMSTL